MSYNIRSINFLLKTFKTKTPPILLQKTIKTPPVLLQNKLNQNPSNQYHISNKALIVMLTFHDKI